MRISDTLKKAAGLFVEIDEPSPEEEFYRQMNEAKKQISGSPDDASPSIPAPTPGARPVPAPSAAPRPTPAAKTIEQVVRDTPGPNLDEIKVPVTPTNPPVDPQGTVDFTAVYKMANLPACSFSAEQMLELLATLPAELPMDTKRATIKVTLNAMAQSTGVSSEAVVADASRKLAALASFAQTYVRNADEYVSKTEVEITALEQEIAMRKQKIEEAKMKQAKVSEACHQESDRLDDVLEFFSLDVPPSKYA